MSVYGPLYGPLYGAVIFNPAWLAARNGLPSDATAVNKSAQAGQFLAAHGITPVYPGTQIITPAGNTGYGYGGIEWVNLGVSDVDQPFTMPAGKTSAGRVTLPLSPAGDGADVTVSLYTDSGGSPGTLITSTRVPAAWIAQLAAPDGLASAGPLATAQSNTLRMGDLAVTLWASPVSGSGAPALPSVTSSGNYIIQAGGEAGAAYVASVYTVGWGGGAALGQVLPQPSLPGLSNDGTLIATGDTLVYAGGSPTLTTITSAVSAAGWDPSTGIAQAWSAQAALPQALYGAAGASDGETVYVIGGASTTGGAVVATVYYATVTNGQVTAWSTGPPLPAGRQNMLAGVVAGWLVAGGGEDSSATVRADTWYAPLGAGGTPGPWSTGPSLPAAVTGQAGCSYAVTPSGIVLIGGFGTGDQVQALTVTADGPAGQWQSQNINPVTAPGGNNPTAAFSLGGGQWETFTITPSGGYYSSAVLSGVPAVSVPLPAAGLTPGAVYHIVCHQDGGDLNDFTQAALDPGALAAAAQTRPAGGGSWTGLPDTYSMLAGVFDQAPGGQVLHTWEDSGARVTSMIYAGAGGQLLGLCEATAFADGTMLAAVTQVTYDGTVPAGTVQLA